MLSEAKIDYQDSVTGKLNRSYVFIKKIELIKTGWLKAIFLTQVYIYITHEDKVIYKKWPIDLHPHVMVALKRLPIEKRTICINHDP